MKASEDVIVRFTGIDELEFISQDGYVDKEIIKSKIKNHEVLVAEHRHIGFIECGIVSGINDGGIGEIFFRKEICTHTD